MGLVVISYTIKDISDPSGYLKSYGAKAIAAVKREERIKTAEAECRSRIKGFEAEMEKEKSRLENQIAIAEQQRNFELRKAENEMAIKTARAVEDAAQEAFKTISHWLIITPMRRSILKTTAANKNSAKANRCYHSENASENNRKAKTD